MMRAKFATLIDECRQMVVSHLTPLLSNLFENADVALLEFAEKAESNAAQQRFFEAMKEIQVKRLMMEQAFRDELQRRFRAFTTSSHSPFQPDTGIQVEEGSGFSLVDQDVFEETVALQNMISKAQMNYGHEIYALRQRLALVIGGRKLEEKEIPGGPHELGECFRVAARQLALEPKIKIIVFVLFDKFVMSQIAGLYQEYNNRLVQAGLLPNLKYEIRKQPDQGVGPARRRDVAPGTGGGVGSGSGAGGAGSGSGGGRGGAGSGAGAAATGGQGQTLGEELFDSICSLLAGRRQTAAATGQAAGANVGGEGVEVMSQPMLVSAIHELQREDASSPVARETLDGQLIPEIQLDTALIDNIKITLVQQREKLFGGVDRRRVGSADADVIDLVGMIFEYMLNDDNIPNAVKALLSRLHTPFLKVAILDKHFFTQEDHPARELLNAMADAGARYVVESDLKRGIFPFMRSAVNRILDEFEDQLSIFAEVLAEFQSRLEQMKHTAEVTEQRTREAATGQEKLQQARLRAQQVIAELMQDAILPGTISQLLQQSWTDKLMFILLRDKDGEQSPFWNTALRIARDIVWSTEPRTTEDARQKLREDLPELQQYLRDGLEMLANFGTGDTDRLYTLITDSQYAALDPLRSRELREEAVARVQENLQPAATLADSSDVSDGDEPVPTVAVSPQLEEMLDVLEYIEFGTWFEFDTGEGQPRQRLKLAWYTHMAGHYMFVDNLGVKAAVMARQALAEEMVAGRARVIVQEKRPFVDRAMETVRNLLRRQERISA